MKGFGKKGFKKQGKKDSGSRGFGSRDSGGFRGKPRHPTMSEVTCDKCGERCSVPFKPRVGKPVYCSKCFRDKEDSSSTGKINSYASEFAKINRKLDRIMEALKTA
ncbi:MAG: CxxC-x17-CxxC domain-containing protein [Candidatus Altiarchaeota archaeon]